MDGGIGKEKVRLNDLGQNIGWMSIDLDLLASLHSPNCLPRSSVIPVICSIVAMDHLMT